MKTSFDMKMMVFALPDWDYQLVAEIGRSLEILFWLKTRVVHGSEDFGRYDILQCVYVALK